MKGLRDEWEMVRDEGLRELEMKDWEICGEEMEKR